MMRSRGRGAHLVGATWGASVHRSSGVRRQSMRGAQESAEQSRLGLGPRESERRVSRRAGKTGGGNKKGQGGAAETGVTHSALVRPPLIVLRIYPLTPTRRARFSTASVGRWIVFGRIYAYKNTATVRRPGHTRSIVKHVVTGGR